MDRISISRYRLEDFLELLVGGVSFVSAILGILTFLQGRAAPVIVFPLVALLGLCIIFFIKIRKLADASLQGLKALADTLKMCTEAVKADSYHQESAKESMVSSGWQ